MTEFHPVVQFSPGLWQFSTGYLTRKGGRLTRDYRSRRVVFGKGLGWRAASAVSPLVFGTERKGGVCRIGKLARYTQIDPRTLRSVLEKLVQSGMLARRGDDGYALNQRNPLKQFVRLTRHGYPAYFRLGVRGANCPLSPSENHVYWWVQSQVEQGRRRLGKKRAVRLTGMPRSTLRLAVSGLFAKGWLATDAEGRIDLPEIDLAAMFPPRAGPTEGRREDTLADYAPSRGQTRPSRRSTERKPPHHQPLAVAIDPLPDGPLHAGCVVQSADDVAAG